MSIELYLESIASSLEAMATEMVARRIEKYNESETQESAAPAPVVPAAPAPVQLSPEALNIALVEQFNRLGGNRAPIDQVFNNHGAKSVSDLDPKKYSAVLADVKAL